MVLKIQTVGLRPDTKHPRGATAAPPTGYTHTHSFSYHSEDMSGT